MSTKLYVGNLAFQTTSNDLQQLFAQAGTVESANVVEDRETGRSRGFAFVEMSTQEEANSAIEQFNGKELGGRALKLMKPDRAKIAAAVAAAAALAGIVAAMAAIAIATATDVDPSRVGKRRIVGLRGDWFIAGIDVCQMEKPRQAQQLSPRTSKRNL